MPFPEINRVLYNKNPLENVVCQLRFPTILKIDTEVPALFQERIRENFPNFTEKIDAAISVPDIPNAGIPPEIISQIIGSGNRKNYEFISEDNDWTVNLTRSFISISTKNYKRWDEFSTRFEYPLNSLIEIYKPNHFSRTGLRYVDIIKRSKLGLDKLPWKDLLNPAIIGLLSTYELSTDLKSHESVSEIDLPENIGQARVVTKLVVDTKDGEVCFMIDSDLFKTSKTDIIETRNILKKFNIQASRLMRWCIKPDLHTAMEPKSI